MYGYNYNIIVNDPNIPYNVEWTNYSIRKRIIVFSDKTALSCENAASIILLIIHREKCHSTFIYKKLQ